MTQAEILRSRKLGEKVTAALRRRHFEAYYCENVQEAREKALSLIPEGDTVAWGGSETLNETGIMAELRSGRYHTIDRDRARDAQERTQLMRESLLADTYITSSNALSEDGQLVNVDGNGNRVAAMIFGPKQVIVVAGINKIVKDLSAADDRVKLIAAPTNALRVNGDAPCVRLGYCVDCDSPKRICKAAVTLHRKPSSHGVHVIIVGEALGY